MTIRQALSEATKLVNDGHEVLGLTRHGQDRAATRRDYVVEWVDKDTGSWHHATEPGKPVQFAHSTAA